MNRALVETSRWFVCPQIKPEAETRLFFFPYAGGGPAVFSRWAGELPNHIETWVAHYPGRGSRYLEPPFRELAALVERAFDAIRPLLDKPFAFFGHSLGGWVAFELARCLHQNGLAKPEALFISACGAPHLPDPHPPIHALPDEKFLKTLQNLNGIPAEVVNFPELVELVLPTLRADFEIIERYCYIPGEHLLDIPIIAYGGLNDPRVSRERLEAWAAQTTSHFEVNYFPGDHFFINGAKEMILAAIANTMKSSPEN